MENKNDNYNRPNYILVASNPINYSDKNMENKQDMTKVAKPSCIGSKWSKWYQAEEDQLLENLRKGIPLKTIATLHNRTYGGISARISVMAYKFYKGGMSINDISEKFNLTVSNIEDRVNIAIFSGLFGDSEDIC